MKVPDIEQVTTEQQARELVVDWQSWQSEQAMSWVQVAQWQSFFEGLGEKFNLTEEFEENGII